MVAPAVLAAASKAVKVAKAAKGAAELASGQGGGKGGGGKKKNNLKWLLVAGVGGLPIVGFGLVFVIMLTAMVGGLGSGAAMAACGDYADNAGTGNTGDKAATNPIMPAGKVYMPSDTARDEIPPRMILASMRAAARYEGLDWTIIAGQMYQETKYGQDKSAASGGDNGLGYKGLLQFGDDAWRGYGDDGNGDGKKDRYNIDDAAYAAANYMHALKVESEPWDALLSYSGSLKNNTVYPRVVLTQSARYRGTLTGDKDLISRWYAHLKNTVDKNPDFPVLGKASDIPEPVGNNAQPAEALSIPSAGARSWSTPPFDGGGQGTTTAMAPVAFSRPLAAPFRPDDPPASSGGKDWQWPLKEGTYKIGTPYHKQGSAWSLGYHTGLDLESPVGTPIYAPADGKVVKTASGGSYGNETHIEHANGVITLYAHQSTVSVKNGDTVKRGDQIGAVGLTGNTFGPHLHWEVRLPGVDNPFISGQDNGPGMIDPEAWLAGKITANPDYGTVPGSNDQAKDAAYRDCAAKGKGTAVLPDGAGSTGAVPDVDDAVVRAALRWAQRGIGKPYVWGATRLQGDNPTSFDCSSFTQWMYYQASGGKIDIGTTTYEQERILRGSEIDLSQAKPGDLIYFGPSKGNSDHVAVVWDPATKKILHAPRPGKNVEFSTWDVQSKIVAVHRVPIPAGTSGEGAAESGAH
ncbi:MULTISPECIES: peptidoglycan DD-metalloendopeptidase family protein [unclassified Streptomyces]|uniref:peptidoglycan DD-metalloendopeptidase family protein n=1 Tax=unclassified Streptomyces TaxID=2593676 RepID=UPI002256962E|nr:peptidoglycan DD-metalloendopeptidase family protein [Streptomyces sp. NBC_01551]MCX4527035.1 peptidoglycan DD-metalloendopeptidase family protein [Streptomyces sp. NBC_01551]